jgi:hypothetical protein
VILYFHCIFYKLILLQNKIQKGEIVAQRKASIKKSFSEEECQSNYADFSANEDEYEEEENEYVENEDEEKEEIYLKRNKSKSSLKDYEKMFRNSDEEFELDAEEFHSGVSKAERKSKESFHKKIVEQDQNSNYDEFYDAICKFFSVC